MGKQIENLRAALKERPNYTCAVCLDIKGPEINTGLHKDGQPITLEEGDIFEINTDEEFEGHSKMVGCNYESLCTQAKVGGTIYLQDGHIMGKIIDVKEVSLNKLCHPFFVGVDPVGSD